jgi:hypothetical protein
MATRDEYEALYREGKELEAKEEGRLPEMAGSTDFYELLGKALGEALANRGKVEIRMDHPTQVRIKVFGSGGHGHDDVHFQLRRELTHYL